VSQESFATVVRRRLLGVLYIVVVVGLIGLSIAIYEKAFSDTVDVKLKADFTGNSLLVDSDVKERGIIVGSVSKVQSKGDGATVTLALDPSRVKDIPAGVTAQILPKTLFGEQYVALQIPDGVPVGTNHITAGATILQDRSTTALEAQQVLGDLLPLLQAVKPAELNATLTAVATALSGSDGHGGQRLGETLRNLDDLLKQFNPHDQAFVNDLVKLGENADLYNSVAPQLFDLLDNLKTSSQTLIDKKVALDNLLTTATNTSAVFDSFLSNNEARLITVVDTSQTIYGLLQQYSPEFTCLIQGVAHLYDLAAQAVPDRTIHLSAVIDNTNQGPYHNGEQPRLITGKGPHCFGLPDNPQPTVNGRFQIPDEFKCLNDGAALTNDPCGKNPNYVQSRALNSPEEHALVDSLIAGALGTTPNKVSPGATMLAAPLLRGQTVVMNK